MKLFVVFACVVAAALANPLYNELELPEDMVGSLAGNSSEDVVVDAADLPEDWHLVPDGDGNMHMVDINHQPPEPRFAAESDLRILLVTRANRNNPTRMQLNNAAQLRSSNFAPNLQTRFIIHGWNNDGNSGVNQLLSNAYLDRGNFNVFIVDWGVGANTANYAAARNRIAEVGRVVGNYIDFLNVNGAPFSAITVVGHSLGGHAAGMVGKNVRRGRIQNIVALDPAFPLFSMGSPNARVHYTDANYVEIIHTDIGRLGFDQPIGHASFYPNWGRNMPGCLPDLAGMCSHSRAWEFFAQTIPASNGFWGTRCAGWHSIQQQSCPPTGPNQLMGGEPVTRAANGVYFLATNARTPWAQGHR